MGIKVIWVQVGLLLLSVLLLSTGDRGPSDKGSATASLLMAVLLAYIGRPLQSIRAMRENVFAQGTCGQKVVLTYLLPIYIAAFLCFHFMFSRL